VHYIILCWHFRDKEAQAKNWGERNNLKIRLEGEVLTTNEFIELLEEKKPKAKAKAR